MDAQAHTPGVASDQSGTVSLPRGGIDPSAELQVLDNYGGLYASSSSLTASGAVLCKKPPCPEYTHRLRRNALNPGDYDARAVMGSTVTSEGNDWGPGVTQQSDLTWFADGTSTVSILPAMTNKGGTPEIAPLRPAPAAALEAERALAVGDSARAFGALASALALARTEADIEGVYGAALRVLRAGGRSQASGAVRVWVRVRADRPGAAQRWALRALAADREAMGDDLGARQVLEALTEGGFGAIHEVHAWRGLVRLAVRAGDEGTALSAFGEMMAAGASEEALRESAALVLAAFPGAVPYSVRARTSGASKHGTAYRAPFAVHPNPARGSAEVTFELAEDIEVSLLVYDALGREVVTLVRGGAFGRTAQRPTRYRVTRAGGVCRPPHRRK